MTHEKDTNKYFAPKYREFQIKTNLGARALVLDFTQQVDCAFLLSIITLPRV